MYRRRHRSSHLTHYILFLLIIATGIYFAPHLYDYFFKFNASSILDNSVLREKKFSQPVQELKSPQYGIKAYLIEDNTNPIISISFLFKNAGRASDDHNRQGISNLVAEMLLEGAGQYNATMIKEEMAEKGIKIGFSAGLDDFSGYLVTTAENQQSAYKLLQDIFSAPHFAPRELDLAKQRFAQAFLHQQEQPGSVLNLEADSYIYGSHPYGRNPLGKLEHIQRLQRDDLLNFMHHNFTRNNIIIGIAGNINAGQARLMLDDIFGSLPRKGSSNFVRQADIDFRKDTKNINRTAGQNISSFVAPSVARSHPDFYPLYVANHILGGSGLSSRLSIAAREQEGLTYSIYSYLSTADKSPLIQGGFSSTKDNFAQVSNILQREWSRFQQQGATQEEVNLAKDYLISSYNLRFSSISTLADILMYMQKENLGADFLQVRNDKIRSVTQKDVNQAAAKYFHPENMLFVNIGEF